MKLDLIPMILKQEISLRDRKMDKMNDCLKDRIQFLSV